MWFPARQKRLEKVKTHPVRGMWIKILYIQKKNQDNIGQHKLVFQFQQIWTGIRMVDFWMTMLRQISTTLLLLVLIVLKDFHPHPRPPSNWSSCKKAGLVQSVHTVISVSYELLSALLGVPCTPERWPVWEMIRPMGQKAVPCLGRSVWNPPQQ